MGFASDFKNWEKSSGTRHGFVEDFKRRNSASSLSNYERSKAEEYKSKFNQYNYNWKSELEYDEWDEEDQLRKARGELPKAVEKAYNFDDPVDVYLYQSGLPPKKNISSYAKLAEDYNFAQEREAEKRKTITKASEAIAAFAPGGPAWKNDSVQKQNETPNAPAAAKQNEALVADAVSSAAPKKKEFTPLPLTVERNKFPGIPGAEGWQGNVKKLSRLNELQKAQAASGLSMEELLDQSAARANDLMGSESKMTRYNLGDEVEREQLELLPMVSADYWERVKAGEQYENKAGGAFGIGRDVNPLTFAKENEQDLRIAAANGSMGGDLRYLYMTPEEEEIYNFYIGRGEKEKAERYKAALQNELAVRMGADEAKVYQEHPAFSVIQAGFAGAENALRDLSYGAKALILGDDKPLDKSVLQESHEQTQPLLSKGYQLLNQVAYSAGDQAPAIFASLLNPAFGSAVFGSKVFSNSYEEAISEGRSQSEALLKSAVTSVLELGLQKVMGGISALSGADNIAQKVINGIDKTSLSGKALAFLGNMTAEGLEEYTQDILDPIVRNLAYGEDNEFKLYTPEAAESFLVGALTAGILNGVTGSDSTDYGEVSSQTEREFQRGADRIGDLPLTAEERAEAIPQPLPSAMLNTDQEAGQTPSPLPMVQAEPLPTEGTEEQPVQVGKATTIKAPYHGKVPVQTQAGGQVAVPAESVVKAKGIWEQAQNTETNQKTVKGFLRRTLESLYGDRYNGIDIVVNGTTFDGQPYNVKLFKSAIDKIVSDKNMSLEKLAVLDNLESTIQSGEYVGSGKYNKENAKKQYVTRYDYFETPIVIELERGNPKEYIASFDVEVYPDKNRFRTYRLNEISLVPLNSSAPGTFSGWDAENQNQASASDYHNSSENATQNREKIRPESLPAVEGEISQTPASGSDIAETLPEVGGFVQNNQNLNENAAQDGNGTKDPTQATPDDWFEAEDKRRILERERAAIIRGGGFGERELAVVEALRKGGITPEQISGMKNRGALQRLADISAQIKEIDQWQNSMLNSAGEIYLNQADRLLEGSKKWKDKTAFGYRRETAVRNMEDIAPTPEKAKELNEALFKPVERHVADMNRWKEGWRKRIEALKLTKEESALVHLVGIGRDTGDENLSRIPDGVTYKNKKPVNKEKIYRAVEVFREFYAEAYDNSAEVLMRNGYPPPGRIKNYFPNLGEEQSDLQNFIQNVLFGQEMALPTEINGLTAAFTPGKPWFANFQKREGTSTTYDAVRGFNQYIDGVGKVIYLTDDIQRIRAFEKRLREKQGLPADDTEMTQKQYGQHLANLASWLHEYGNNLAGKTAKFDRALEDVAGRRGITIMKWMKKRFGANAVGANMSTALSNFIPLTQGIATMPKRYFIEGLGRAAQGLLSRDGFGKQSDFLTRRFGGGEAVTASTKEKVKKGVNKTLSAPFEAIDRLVSETLVRGKYQEQLSKGMSPEQAMAAADDYAAKTMADRSIGQQPLLFENKTLGFLTQFQLEVNNQVSNIFKDIPRWNNGDTKKVAAALLELFMASWAFNEICEKYLTGRRPAIDPIHAIDEFIEDLGEEREDGESNTGTALVNLGRNFLDMLPGGQIITGGGRVPLASALEGVDLIGAIRKSLNKEADAGITWRDTATAAVYNFILPAGGAQLKKVIEGIGAVLEGGSFKDTKEGEILQFYTNQNAEDYLKAGISGKYALPQAQEYVDGGFKSLSVKETAAFRKAREAGVEPQHFMDLNKEFEGMKTIKDEEGKTELSESEQKRRRLMEDEKLSVEQKTLLDEGLISEEGKAADYSDPALFELWLIDRKTHEKALSARAEGLEPDLYLDLYRARGEIDKTDQKATDKATEFDRYMREIGLSDYQRRLAHEYLGFYTPIKADPKPLPDVEVEGLPMVKGGW